MHFLQIDRIGDEKVRSVVGYSGTVANSALTTVSRSATGVFENWPVAAGCSICRHAFAKSGKVGVAISLKSVCDGCRRTYILVRATIHSSLTSGGSGLCGKSQPQTLEAALVQLVYLAYIEN
jgi:hypothetical protein